MAPLLYEQSQQAQFLKPTVITLVYGLGFGMFLVLLVVPALVAAQHDIGRQIRAMRRAMRARAGGLRTGILGLWLLMLLWGGATLGWVAVTGGLHPALAEIVPTLGVLSPRSAALLLFLAGAAAIALAGYVVGAVIYASSRKKAAG
tara:strand:- start:400 stop:837 length:438 start_codon:yes stop_codon:yes gene_type:complete